MAAQILCPFCRTVLALSEAYYGKQVRCRQCNQVFRAEPPAAAAAPTPAPTPAAVPPKAPTEKPRAAAPPPPPVPPKAPVERRPERTRTEKPRAERVRNEPPRKSKKKLVLGIILSVLFLGCGGVSFAGYKVYRWVDDKAERIRKLRDELTQVPDNQREAPPAAVANPGFQGDRFAKLKDGQFVRPPRGQGLTGRMDVVSPDGDYIGAGKTYRYTDVEMTLSMQKGVLVIEAGGWKLELAAPQGETLGVGVYREAKRYPFNDNQPGIAFGGNGRGCNKIAGEFVIWELEMEAGQIVRVAVDFIQRCEGTMPPLTGMVRFNSVYAP